VTIADLDRSACGGTHVRATGEIGPILIRKAERVKQQVRLEFLCGARSVRRARIDFEVLSTLASSASSAIDDLPALFEKLRAEQKAADSGRRALEESLHRYRARELYEGAAAGPHGRRQVIYRATEGSVESLRGLAQAMMQLPNVVLIASLPAPPTLFLASSPDSGVDAGQLLRGVMAEFGGRGGGNSRLAQGTAPDLPQMETALARLASAV
jgi:alanyl-tRNA synthetase